MRILDKLKDTPDDLEIALRALTWLLYCSRPLKLSHLASAASIDPDTDYDEGQKLDKDEDIFDICRSLIYDNKESGVVEFSHISVTQFLQSPTLSNRQANPYYRNDATGHAMLMKSCLMYLSSPYLSSILSQLHKSQILRQLRAKFRDAFAFYAVYGWPMHAKMIEPDIVSPVIKFLTSDSFASWRELWELTDLHEHHWWETEKGESQAEDIWSDAIVCELVSASRLKPGTPLYYAALLGLKLVVEELLLQNHDANGPGGPNFYPLFAALDHRNLDVAESLLRKGGNVNIQDQVREDTAMHRAIEKGDKVVAKFLLDKEADVTVCNARGHAPLHLALKRLCSHKKDLNPELINMLAMVNVNVKNKRGRTAVHLAVDLGCVPSVSLLIQQGADVNITDDDGRTALHMASKFGKTEIVDILLNSKCDLRIADLLGYTALHLAVQSGEMKMAEKLLRTLEGPSDSLGNLDACIHPVLV
jgi:ankyrin repeat protein